MKLKFKDLPITEQEGYVLAYTDKLKVKGYLLCYLHTDKALEKLNKDDEEFFKINETITRYDGNQPFEERIKKKSKEVMPIVERLINEGRFFGKNRDYQTLFEMVEDETWAFRNIPEAAITDVLVDHYVDHNKRATILFFPEKYMTAERFIKLSKKDYNAACRVHKYIHLLSEDDLLHLLCSDIREMALNIPKERWTKELLYGYLEYCVRNNKEPGFVDERVNKGVPVELKDKVYYQCCCMIGGFYYSRIPNEMREIVISKKLIAETIKRWDMHRQKGTSMNYNGLGWMLQFLPEKFKTTDVCIEVCKRYPYAIGHVPDDVIKEDIFWKEVLVANLTPLMELDNKREHLLPADVLQIRKESVHKDLLQKGTVQGKTAGEWEDVLSHQGARIYDMPSALVTLDMLLIAMKSNSYALEKDLSILDYLTDDDKKKFWETVVSEKLFYKPISVPDEFMTEACVLEWVEKSSGYDVDKISEKFRTENVMLKIAKFHPDRFTFPLSLQTQELIDTLISLQEKDISKTLILKKTRADLQRQELVNDLCQTQPYEMLSLGTISKEQISMILSKYPHLIINAPLWYILDLRKGTPELDADIDAKANCEAKTEDTNESIKELIETTDDTANWTQLSIFDYLVA